MKQIKIHVWLIFFLISGLLIANAIYNYHNLNTDNSLFVLLTDVLLTILVVLIIIWLINTLNKNNKQRELIGELNQLNAKISEREFDLKERNNEYVAINDQLQQTIQQLNLAKEQTKESEKKFRNITGNIPGLVLRYKLNKDGSDELIYLSKSVESIYEIKHADAINNTNLLWERIHPDDLDKYKRTIEKSATELSFWKTEHRILMPDGRIKWIDARAVPFKGEDDCIVWDTLGIDITDRKETEQKLLENRHYLEKSQEIGKIGTWHLDIVNNIVTWTDENYKIFGVKTNTQMNYERFMECVHPEDREFTDIEWKKGIKNNSYDIEHRLLVNGEVKWVREKAEFIFDDKNKVIGAFGVTQDITDRKKNEQALIESEAKFRNIFELSQAMIGIADVNTATFKTINPAFSNILGYTQEELLSKSFLNFVHPDDKEATIQVIEKKLKAGEKVFHFVNRYLCKDKKYKWINWNAYSHIQDGLLYAVGNDITNRKKAEEALKESEEKIRYILKHNPNAIAVFDNNMDILLASDRFKKDYQVEQQNIIGRNNYEVFPEIPERWRKIHQRALKGEVLQNEDDYFIRPDGSKTYSRWECRPWYHSDGSIGGMIAYTEVTTERKLAEIALKESEEKYRLITENATDAIWVLNLTQQKFTYVSPSVFNLRGYTPEEVMKQGISESLTPESAKIVTDGVSEAMREFLKTPKGSSKIINRYELQQPCKNGEIIWTEITTRFQFNSNNEVELIGISRNIDDRKKAEQELQEKSHRLKLATDSGELGIWDWYLSEGVMIWNDRMFELYGIKQNTFSNNIDAWTNGLHPEDKQGAIDECNIALDGDSDFDTTFRVLHPNGTVKYLKANAIVIRDNSGKAIRMTGINKDVTESILAEQSLKTSESQLKELNATKDKLFSIIAHDLRSPFNSILGLSDLLKLTYNTENQNIEEAESIAKMIHASTKSTLILLDNLLTWAKSQRGQVKFDPVKLNLEPIIVEIFDLLKPTAESKNISLNYNQSINTEVHADENMLRTVLRNLISNGIKFTNADGKIEIYATHKKNFIEITISDNGVGMSEESIGKLFKIDKSVTTRGTANEKGSGLGLILCKEFVDKHSGRIWVESEVGKGSAFKFTLPDS